MPSLNRYNRTFMTQSTVPRVENRWVCIATNAQVAFAAIVSSYVQEAGVYLPVFEFPRIDVPYLPSSDFEEDGYLGRIMGDRAAHEINNCLARIQPDSILLLGMSETEKSYLRVLLPPMKLIEINTLEELPARIPFASPAGDPVRCKSSQLIEGLLLAKFSQRPLLVDESAAPLPENHLHGGEGILLIENDRDIHDVAAINYACALNADVVLVLRN